MANRSPCLYNRTRGALLIGAVLACAWAATAQAETAPTLEERLAAIRQGLVQAALEGPTQVTATQWIDAQGALRESSSFRSGMQVRGVRVIGYDSDEQGDVKAKIDWQTLKSTGAAPTASAKTATPVCKPVPAGHLQHVVAWSWSNPLPWNIDDVPVIDALQATLEAQWQQASAHSALWRWTARTRQEDRTAYQQALLGTAADDAPWQLTVQVTPARKLPPETGADPAVSARKPVLARLLDEPLLQLQVQLRMTLSARNESRPVMQSTVTLGLQATADNWALPHLQDASRQLVEQQVSKWSQELQAVLNCRAVTAEVTQANGTLLRINAGSVAGVRVGDEWFLADGQNFPQRILERGIPSQTVLAKVQYVGPFDAQLRAVAGPAPSVQRNWSAWSAQDVR